MPKHSDNPTWQYHVIARLFHWILAIFLIGQIILGWYMVSIETDPTSDWYFNSHETLGMIIAAFVLLRVIWRLTHKPAPLPAGVSQYQMVISKLTYILLYLCMIIMPITGFIGSSYSEYGVSFFGWQLPNWLSQNHHKSEILLQIHIIISWVLVVLIVLHILTAVKHLIMRDGVFRRIMFFL